MNDTYHPIQAPIAKAIGGLMTEITHKIGEQGAAVIDTTKQDWRLEKREVAFVVLQQQAKDALSYPEVMGEFS